MDHNLHSAAEAVSATATKVTGASGLGLVLYGGLTLQEWGVIAGVIIGVGGWVTNWYFKTQMLKIERERMERHAAINEKLAEANIQPIGDKDGH